MSYDMTLVAALKDLEGCAANREQAQILCDAHRGLEDALIKLEANSMLVRQIVAWFDVMHSKYVVDGTPVELSEEWPSHWLREARKALEKA